MDARRFLGFADPERRFLRSLARRQDRAWFGARRHIFERDWALPMRHLLDEAAMRLAPCYRQVSLRPPHLFRIHRDMRFSADKAPFKAHIGGMIELDVPAQGPRVQAPTALYFHVGIDIVAAAGQYVLEGERLQRFRTAVLDAREGPQVERMLAPLLRAGYRPGALTSLKRAPRGVQSDHPRAYLLRLKGLVLTFPPIAAAVLRDRALLNHLVHRARRVAPVIEWLADLA